MASPFEILLREAASLAAEQLHDFHRLRFGAPAPARSHAAETITSPSVTAVDCANHVITDAAAAAADAADDPPPRGRGTQLVLSEEWANLLIRRWGTVVLSKRQRRTARRRKRNEAARAATTSAAEGLYFVSADNPRQTI